MCLMLFFDGRWPRRALDRKSTRLNSSHSQISYAVFCLINKLITGTIFVEVIFRVPGLGKFFVTSISLRDYPMIMATMLLVATLWSFTYLASDLLYTVVDPRVRLFGKAT